MIANMPKHGRILLKQDCFSDPSFPLQVDILDSQREFPLHSHSFNELALILGGSALHLIDGEKFAIKAGDAFVIPPGRLHQYTKLNYLVIANILFDPKTLGLESWDIQSLPGFHAFFCLEPAFRSKYGFRSRLQLSNKYLLEAKNSIHHMSEEMKAAKPGYKIAVSGLFMHLAVTLSRCYSETPSEESLDLLRLGSAIAHIETNYHEHMDVNELAKISNLSRRHFMRTFSECMGTTPMNHLMRVRINRAAQMLLETDRTITDIAFDCGFSDSNYFARCFRKILDKSPSQHRGV